MSEIAQCLDRIEDEVPCLVIAGNRKPWREAQDFHFGLRRFDACNNGNGALPIPVARLIRVIGR
jgi:hypothetical protein